MITGLYFLLVGVGALVALSNWRLGLLVMLIAGALQDPVRKMMPQTPGWMVLAFAPILFAILFNLFLGSRNTWAEFMRAYPRLRQVFQYFILALALALLVLVTNYGVGAWRVGAIGLIGYVFPMLAIAMGFVFVRTTRDLLNLIRCYCAITAVLLVGGLLEHWEVFPDWPALGTEALDTIWIRHVPGYIVQLTSGFYRSPDLMGWHAALLVMFSLLMALYSRGAGARVGWVALAVWGATILLISGRNKMIFMPPIFVAVMGVAYLYKGNIDRMLSAGVAAVVALALFFGLNAQLELDREYLDYVEVGTENTPERLRTHGIEAVIETYRQSGFFGEGLGTASTGARYGSGGNIRTWQESGPSKLMVELGVVGFIATAMLLLALVRVLWRCLKRMPRQASGGLMFIGFLGILAANGASFLVSHQAFGDPFLVTLAGFFIGVALSAPRWAFFASGRGTEPARA